MLKTAGLIILVLAALVMFITPVRNYCNSLLHKEKSGLSETQIIGAVSGYNPRVEGIQKILQDAHFEPGAADGVMGSRTRQAIRRFQKEKGLWPSGKIDSKTWLELSREKEGFRKEAPAWPPALPSESCPREVGPGGETAKTREPEEKALKADIPGERKKQIQAALQKAGFYKGKIDGKIGPQTKEAIKAFQKVKGLKIDGAVGAQTWAELSKHLKE